MLVELGVKYQVDNLERDQFIEIEIYRTKFSEVRKYTFFQEGSLIVTPKTDYEVDLLQEASDFETCIDFEDFTLCSLIDREVPLRETWSSTNDLDIDILLEEFEEKEAEERIKGNNNFPYKFEDYLVDILGFTPQQRRYAINEGVVVSFA